jgi:hypothetical protein
LEQSKNLRAQLRGYGHGLGCALKTPAEHALRRARNTIGSATIAESGALKRDRVRASHQASGVPSSNKITVVRVASLRVTHSAAKIAVIVVRRRI